MAGSPLCTSVCFGCNSRLHRFCAVRRRRRLVVRAGVPVALAALSLVALLLVNAGRVMARGRLVCGCVRGTLKGLKSVV